jgi:hypothetical protein
VYNDVSARDASPRRIGEPGGRTSRRRLPFRRSSGRLRLALGCGLTWSTLPSHGWAGRAARVRTAVLDAAVAELVERVCRVESVLVDARRRSGTAAGRSSCTAWPTTRRHRRRLGHPACRCSAYYRLLVLAEPLSGEVADPCRGCCYDGSEAGVFGQWSQRTDRKSS